LVVVLGGTAGALSRTNNIGGLLIGSAIEAEAVPDGPPVFVADEEILALAPGMAHCVVSVLGLHLVNDLPGALKQIEHALMPDGLFIGALLGGGSLQELRETFLQAETELLGGASPRVAPFADIRDLGGLMQRAGFALPVIDAETVTVRYDHMLDLIRDLRHMGWGPI